MKIFDVQKLIFEVFGGSWRRPGQALTGFWGSHLVFWALDAKMIKMIRFLTPSWGPSWSPKIDIKTWKIPFPKACWKNIDFYTILKPKSRLFRRRRTSKNSDFACEGWHFLEHSLIEVGSRKKRARRRSGEAILGSKIGWKWEKWGPKGRLKSKLFLRLQKVTQQILAAWVVRPQKLHF